MKGVGVGRGVSAATTPSGVRSVPVGERGMGVDVRKGTRVAGREVDTIPWDVQDDRRRRKEVRRVLNAEC
jgi:hypothetical protein